MKEQQDETIPNAIHLGDGGAVPNNPVLPVLVYRAAIALDAADPGEDLARLFTSNGWAGVWFNGIFPYHHYHATAHEVLGIASGSVSVQIGGASGDVFVFEPGDVVVLPAGTGHKRVSDAEGLLVVGAYPPGQHPDMKYGRLEERPRADRKIVLVPLPASDPVHGPDGPLMELWHTPGP